ncbi:glyoxylase-like metal-dependent hydrolase (beta-lactamase superfamily II)/rhodanese-related sulfurtransferase [Saccharopolyspora phatthalungensis]|uniref:Glyoxylase-like metal-dependent hydrolase (Beta-lactamase superfamily II)/rhodanese-related sulfurtransferase n=1 Tax=Saccharopolyspora phatthalungensis TaxID=664693 RepID=A0A840Q6Z1_9PSEU|nr:glyoxylase-like metal-dependent hydrolase (beta-lactamase superfamily II)/rhodanese-related sulfurtransferase [Saccharopolyspora phatthalungensis]
MAVEVVETASLGDRSYLVTDGAVAAVVDPQRDIDRMLALAGRHDVRITHVLETHIHNDYLSGGLELCRLTGAEYGVAASDVVSFARRPLVEGDVVVMSQRLRLRTLATPGHTFHHLSYVVEDTDGAVGVFTGGSLLFGSTGRTDLLGQQHSEELARQQHASVRKLADVLPDDAQIWPTHGFGNFCSATEVSGSSATVGQQKKVNAVFRLGEDEFVEHTLSALDAVPAYYAQMAPRNMAGPEQVDLRAPARVRPAELARRLRLGDWVVDLRSRRAFAHAHLAGTISLGLDGPLATWLGWLADRGAPLTLIGETPEQVAAAQRELVRIGVDRPTAAVGRPRELAVDASLVRSMPSATFGDLAESGPGSVVLDVRMRREWRACHLKNAVHIPLFELRYRSHELADGVVWVHCSAGYRAAAAASLLAREGREVVFIDDEFAAAHEAGLPLVSDRSPPGR